MENLSLKINEFFNILILKTKHYKIKKEPRGSFFVLHRIHINTNLDAFEPYILIKYIEVL